MMGEILIALVGASATDLEHVHLFHDIRTRRINVTLLVAGAGLLRGLPPLPERSPVKRLDLGPPLSLRVEPRKKAQWKRGGAKKSPPVKSGYKSFEPDKKLLRRSGARGH